MEGDGDDIPPTERQRLTKLPGGQYYLKDEGLLVLSEWDPEKK